MKYNRSRTPICTTELHMLKLVDALARPPVKFGQIKPEFLNGSPYYQPDSPVPVTRDRELQLGPQTHNRPVR